MWNVLAQWILMKKKKMIFSFVPNFLSNKINIKHLQKWKDVFSPSITEFCRGKHTLLCPQPLKIWFRRKYCCLWFTAVWVLILQSAKDSRKVNRIVLWKTTCRWNCPTDFRASATSQVMILTAYVSPPLYNTGPCLRSAVQTVGMLLSSHILNPHFSGKKRICSCSQYKNSIFSPIILRDKPSKEN